MREPGDFRSQACAWAFALTRRLAGLFHPTVSIE